MQLRSKALGVESVRVWGRCVKGYAGAIGDGMFVPIEMPVADSVAAYIPHAWQAD
jgi:hypothetical protein